MDCCRRTNHRNCRVEEKKESLKNMFWEWKEENMLRKGVEMKHNEENGISVFWFVLLVLYSLKVLV